MKWTSLEETVDGYVKSCSVIFRSWEGGDNISRQCDVGVSDQKFSWD
jgi:hypothetical protein